VQTGLGRTGTFFAFEQWNVEPDLVSVAKALSGGYVPVGAVIAKREIVEKVFDKMDRAVVHSSTFGMNVRAMTAGLATLHTLDAEHLVAQAANVGAELISGLREVAGRHEVVHEARAAADDLSSSAGPGCRGSVSSGRCSRRARACLRRSLWCRCSTTDPRPGCRRPSERAEDPAAAHHHVGAGEGLRRRASRGAHRVERSLGFPGSVSAGHLHLRLPQLLGVGYPAVKLRRPLTPPPIGS
jgi:hypothetical protein